MLRAMTKPTTGAEDVRWDLTDLYKSIDDPALDADLEKAMGLARGFAETHRGKLAEDLGGALRTQARMTELVDKMFVYLFLNRSTDAKNELTAQQIGRVQEAWSRAAADHLNFFEHELCAIDDAVYAKALETDDYARQHQPMLDKIREDAKFLLDENVERALTLRSPYGPGEWSDYSDEWEADLRFDLDDEARTLPEILHVINSDADGDKRARALKSFSEGMKTQRFDRFMARTLNVVMGAKAVEDRERGYPTAMTSRNRGNWLDDQTVETLHDVVADEGAAQCRRYYRLLSAHLGMSPLRWSDRNAPLPFQDTRVVPWQECVDTVVEAYSSFSGTLAGLIRKMFDQRWVDAPPDTGKVGGAFNYSVCLPNGEARAYNFLNYMGSTRDVMTVAHELGHGAHGMLSGETQGPLQFRTGMAYAETASIFGEMTTFEFLLKRAETDEQRLALLMSKSNDFLNSVVRQISFSNFERAVHAKRRESGKLTVEEFDAEWMKVTHAFYGDDGDVFTYDNAGNLWTYVSHFLRPFYVYAYAFGELFTQSLFAAKQKFAGDFEPMYVDLLRAGSTKDAVALMKPFDLDPRSAEFWRGGISASITRWLDEAEAISKRMGVSVD